MKAKEYYVKYTEKKEEKGSDYAIVSIFFDMFNEIGTIKEARKVKRDSAMLAIFNEMNLINTK